MTDLRTEPVANPYLRALAPFVPYVAVLVGLFVLSSGWASILLYHLGMAIILTVTKGWVTPRMSQSVRCRWMLALMVAGAALVGPVLYAAWSTVRIVGSDLAAKLAELGLEDEWWLLFVLYYFTVNPVLEETYWRGFLGSDAKWPVWNDGFFAGYHVFVIAGFVGGLWVMAGFLGLIGAAWLWRQVARECGGLLIPMVSHAVADASLIAAALLLAA